MNIFTQIAIGVIPATVLFVVLSIIGKKSRVRNIAVAVMFVLILIADVTAGFIYKGADSTVAGEGDAITRLKLVYAVADEEEGLALAAELLKDLRADAEESPELTVCDALIRAAKGDYRAAKALLNKASSGMEVDYGEKFAELCNACIAESKIDYAAAGKLGQTVDGAAGDAVERLKEFAKDKLSENLGEDSGALDKAAEVLVESEALYSQYLHSNTLDESQLKKLTKRISSAIEEDSSLLSVPQLRLCRLKLMVLDGDYKSIAQMIDSESTYDEIAIVSELYISGLVKESSFSAEYAKDYVKIYEKVSKQLSKTIKNIPDENESERRDAEELAKQLKDAVSSPALYKLKDSLAKYAADESFSDRPKAYMQLARVEYETGSENRAQDHITASLGTIGICEDDNFTVPMSAIVDAITDKNDPEKLKNVAQYVEDVTASTADVVVGKAVTDAASKEDSDEESSGGSNWISNGDSSSETKEETVEFDSFMTDYVSRKRVSFNITDVDATEFETVRATLSVDDSVSITAEELKNMISLKDCGATIENFTVEKVEYKGANILLLCDVSGSMSGQPISDLRDAVKLFADTATDIEHLALVTFSDGVEQVYDFGTSNADISSAASGLHTTGGTNMYDSIIASLEKFSVKEGELNFILLLSDGEDNVIRSNDQIMTNIGVPSKDKGVVLYSLGLGSYVNTDYMNSLALTTGGSFLYINDSATLSSFYDYLRGQILNQYIITFTAEDTLSVDRELKITLKDDPLTGDVGYYSLRDGEDGESGTADDLLGLEDKGVYGLDTRLIYRSSHAVSVNLKGFGFTAEDKFSVELDGDLDYGDGSVSCTFVDESTVNLLIPGGIACGEYDVRVSVNGRSAILEKELTVVAQGQEKTTAFGPYVFTSYKKTEQPGNVTLSNYVVLNGWLNFNGDVVLTGDLNSESVSMTENFGSYIKFSTDTATGLASYMAKRGSVFNIPALGTMTLHNDPNNDPESENYRVDARPTGIMSIANVLAFNEAGVELYPNRIEIKSDSFNTKLPMQDMLLKSSGLDELFKFQVTLDGVVTNKTVGFVADVKKGGEDDIFNPVNMGSMPIYISPASYEIHIDTVKNEYSVEYSTKVAFIDSEGIGFQVEWKERGLDSGLQKLCPSKIMLMSDTTGISAHIGTVPVTYRDFKLGVDDIDPNASILDWMLVGSFDVESVKVSDYLPGLNEWIEDPAIIMLDDVTIKFSYGQAYISVSAEMKLLEEISLAKAQIQAGRIPFTSVMLGMNNVEAKGLQADLTVGIIWESDNCDIDLSGTAMFSAHSRFMGVEVKGTCDLTIEWWIFEKSMFAEGRAVLGMYVDNSGRDTFIVKARSTKDSGSKEYYVFWNEDSGIDCGVKKL